MMSNTLENIGSFRLQKKLGLGKLCEIWAANDTSAEGNDQKKLWAVKFLVADAVKDRAQRKLLEHELKVSKSLAHPGIIRIDRFEVIEGIPLLVMELFDHPNLKTQLAEAPDSLSTRTPRILTEAALAIAHMHSRGWVHRDIKPDNLLASPEGQVKVIDMALAVKKAGVLGRLLGGSSPRGRGLVQGTPSYMSPEQIRGQAVDARADIYSFGCTAFELLAGRPPFQSRTQAELLQMQLTTQPPSVEAYNRNVPKGIVRLIRKMLSKNITARPASMDDVVEQLRSFRKLERATQA
jgi:serine/threonine protein kinase